MEASADRILAEALKLSEPERAQLLQRLLDSLSPDAKAIVDRAWAEELDRRLSDFQQGPADAMRWTERDFESMGFHQELTGSVIETLAQCLTPAERTNRHGSC